MDDVNHVHGRHDGIDPTRMSEDSIVFTFRSITDE